MNIERLAVTLEHARRLSVDVVHGYDLVVACVVQATPVPGSVVDSLGRGAVELVNTSEELAAIADMLTEEGVHHNLAEAVAEFKDLAAAVLKTLETSGLLSAVSVKPEIKAPETEPGIVSRRTRKEEVADLEHMFAVSATDAAIAGDLERWVARGAADAEWTFTNDGRAFLCCGDLIIDELEYTLSLS